MHSTPPPFPSELPFAAIGQWLRQASSQFTPPQWFTHEAQQRVVLLLNHILMQDSAAQQRLAEHKGRAVSVSWQRFSMMALITPAGLLNLAGDDDTQAALRVRVSPDEPLALAQLALSGQRPEVHIEGDARLAAAIGWVIDNVRWDLQRDMARITGDVPAQLIATVARAVAQAVAQFASSWGGQTATAPGSDKTTGLKP